MTEIFKKENNNNKKSENKKNTIITKITDDSDNPQTGDNIGVYMITMTISGIGLASGIYVYRRKLSA